MACALSVWAGWMAWSDWRRHRIPNTGLVLVLIPALLCLVLDRQGLLQTAMMDSLLGFLVAGGLLLPGYALGYMGAGDVKLASVMGLLLGALPAFRMLLVFALLLGAVSAVALWVYRRQPQANKRRIAAAPVLALGFISQLFFSEVFGLLQGLR